jgi:Integrase core domain
VRTVFFRTLYVFFVMHHETRQILQVRVTRHPTADWAAQQIVDACGWDRDPPRYLIRDRDSRYGEAFDRRLRGLGVRRLRTPVKAPRANALAERWVRSARTECLDHLFIVDERHLQRALNEGVAYFNAWRPHRGLGQRVLCGPAPPPMPNVEGQIIGRPVLGGRIMYMSTQRDAVLAPYRLVRSTAVSILRPDPGTLRSRAELCPKLCPRPPATHPNPPYSNQPAKEKPLGKSATYRGGSRAPPALEGRCSIQLSYRRVLE